MPAKLINFTATSLNSANYTVLLKTFNGRHSHGPGSDHDLCLPEDGLAPDSDHMAYVNNPLCSLVRLAGTRLFWFPG